MKPRITKYLTLPVLLALFYIVIMTPLMGRKMGYTVDATASFQLTRAIVETGDPFPHIAVKQGYIYSLVYIPFYLLGATISNFFPDLKEGWVERKVMCWMNTFITALTLGLLSEVVRRLGYSPTAQIVVPLLYGFSTIAFAYARYDYNKSLAGFLLLLSFYFYIRWWVERRDRSALWCGIAAGLLAALRAELAVAALVYAAAIVWQSREKRSLILYAIPIAIGGTFVLLYNYFYWQGSAAGGYEGGFQPNPFPGIVGFLFSPGKSIFIFNPVLLLLPLVIRLYSQRHATFWVWCAHVILIFLVYSFWGNWWGGWGYGPRHLVPLLPLLVLPLAAIVDEGTREWHIILASLGLLGATVHFLCCAIDFNDVILNLTNSNIAESEMIWTPIFSPLLHHFLFLRHMPLENWDYGIIYLYANSSGLAFFGALVVWLILTVGIGYKVFQLMHQEPQPQESAG